MTTNQLERGETVACDRCGRSRTIETAVVELFGADVGFGPAGETDMFTERDGTVLCYRCISDDLSTVAAEPDSA